MSGPTIGNWNKFDANVFKSISGVPDENTKLDEADTHRPMSMMQCMVAVIKQNILTSLKALGAGSARTVTTNLTNDGIIGNNNNVEEAKESRFVEFWP